jgi:transposase
MATIARKADGRRIFTDEFKRKQLGHVWRGEMTLAELSRKLGIARSLLQRWKRLLPEGHETAGAAVAGVRVAPAVAMRAEEYIRELQLLVGKQAIELELLRSELGALRQGRRSVGMLER